MNQRSGNNNNQNRGPGGNQRGGQPGGGGQGGGGGSGNNNNRGGRNRFKRKRRHGGGGQGGGGGGNNRNQDNRHQQNQNRGNSSRPQDDLHPLDPMRFIKVGKNAQEPNRNSGKTETFGVVFFDTVSQALAAKEAIAQKASSVSHLNIVIKAEADRNIPDLLAYGRVFAGEAWTIIHQRRVDDGWYNEAHEWFLGTSPTEQATT